MECAWKANWSETKRNYTDWWNRDGLVLSMWSPGGDGPRRDGAEAPPKQPSPELRHTDARWRARRNHYALAGGEYLADMLPLSETDIGPGSLALFLGSEPGFGETTVWFHESMPDDPQPERRAPFRFDPENKWWRITEEILNACAGMARGKYLVGCPDLIENIDTLASLRGTQQMLVDLADRPEWVEQKMFEINQVWFDAYQRIYDIIKLPDGSSAWGAFRLWGPGKTGKLQCDASAMFSPAMFEQFVVPAMSAQCDWLDYSMFHLDGHQCICHLDALLGIEGLDAIEWTPDPQVPRGGSPHWYDMYRRILASGKSVQAIGVRADEVVPLLDAVGGKGMYIRTQVKTRDEAEELVRKVQPYRR